MGFFGLPVVFTEVLKRIEEVTEGLPREFHRGDHTKGKQLGWIQYSSVRSPGESPPSLLGIPMNPGDPPRGGSRWIQPTKGVRPPPVNPFGSRMKPLGDPLKPR